MFRLLRKTHVNLRLVDQIVSAEKLTVKQFVLAYQNTSEVLRAVDQNVLSARNVHKTELVSIKNVPTLVRELVALMQIAKRSTTVQYAVVRFLSRAIHLPGAIPYLLRLFQKSQCLTHVYHLLVVLTVNVGMSAVSRLVLVCQIT